MLTRRSGILVLLTIAFLPTVAATAEPPAVPDLSGRWSGTWCDSKSGHHGPLHATICRIDDCHYLASFTGRFWKVVPFHYAIELNVVGVENGRVLLAGSKRMLGSGQFEMNGSAGDCDFTATFCSKRYTGQFDLTRSGR